MKSCYIITADFPIPKSPGSANGLLTFLDTIIMSETTHIYMSRVTTAQQFIVCCFELLYVISNRKHPLWFKESAYPLVKLLGNPDYKADWKHLLMIGYDILFYPKDVHAMLFPLSDIATLSEDTRQKMHEWMLSKP